MDSRLAPIRRFLRPPLYIPVGVTLLLGASYAAQVLAGVDVDLLINLLVWVITIAYFWGLWGKKLKWREETLRRVCRNYGVDALAEDFRVANALNSDLKLGQQFLFSRDAVEILALEKITGVRVQIIRRKNLSEAHVICTAQGLRVTVTVTDNDGHEIADLIRERCGEIQQKQIA